MEKEDLNPWTHTCHVVAKSLANNANYSSVAANGKLLMRLIGLDTQKVNHQQRFKHSRFSLLLNQFLKIIQEILENQAVNMKELTTKKR